MTSEVSRLERELNSFDAGVRARALAALKAMVQRGELSVEPARDVVNMHAHSFFSYSAYGHSPTSLAWHAKRRGIRLIGKIEFDVTDGIDEFLAACDSLALRASAGIETRVFVSELADREVNSPGEPGVCYHMGVGFTASQVTGQAARILAALRERAAQRNLGVAARVNAYLDPVTINYDRDVLPLTPGGNPTERHMVVAYIAAAERTVGKPAEFWARKLHVPPDQMADTMQDTARFQAFVRARLMKRGGVGYVPPGPGTFATVEEYHTLIVDSGALPCSAWLDGSSEGERDTQALLEMWVSKGVLAQNVIPEYARKKPDNMRRLARIADGLALPLHIGTEMNSYGQRWLDEFDAPDLAPLRQVFLDGAHCIYGHVVMQRALGAGYQSAWAHSFLPSRRGRKDFYTRIGYRVPPGAAGSALVRKLDPTMSPADMLTHLGE